jgi:murein DD-endopeptidase MepM/ murein hydrolase activator NlpD
MTFYWDHRDPQRIREPQRNSRSDFADSHFPVQLVDCRLSTRILTLLTLMTLLTPCTSFGQLTNKEITGLKSGRASDDTSYVYSLPYKVGTSQLFVQGSNSRFSHKHELAYDFKMKTGTEVYAARGGVVTDLRKDSDRGGLKDENLSDGNYVYIEHSDGSIACYWHLQKDGVTVKEGELVEKGQLIGYSGNTGYSAFPHLHFQVMDANGKQILVRFATGKGNIYLRPGNSYRRP